MREQLKGMAEETYRAFSASLLPGVEPILGVRLPALRKLARQISKGDFRAFLAQDMYYFEEYMLHGFVLGCAVMPLKERFERIAAFVPKIDNWSVCDSFCSSLKFAKEFHTETWEFLLPYVTSKREYELRFGIVMLLFYYLEPEYIDRVLEILSGVRHEAYYVKMAVAWALSMAYVAFPQKTRSVVSPDRLDSFTYEKTLQKIIESRQITDEVRQQFRAEKKQARENQR